LTYKGISFYTSDIERLVKNEIKIKRNKVSEFIAQISPKAKKEGSIAELRPLMIIMEHV
jgi:hypothetical protein